ncbi:MAG: hypothetical protein MUF24_05545 [Chitinophagaceae bacterium]|jgi:hypothetical protein|nr:hypothetical protein [Chitinophagaceae bacterium]
MQLVKTVKSSILLCLIIAGTLPANTYAQGCSDAGFCSIGAIKPTPSAGEPNPKNKHRFAVLTPFGQGDDGVIVFTPGFQYDFTSAKGWNIQTKITGNYASGNLGSYTGAGDVFIAATRTAALSNQWSIAYTAGVKIPLSTSNGSEAGMPLPMQYQSSIGTFDGILGLTLANTSWQFSAGYQQPLSGANKNGFLPAFWNGKPEANNYPSTFRLNRKGDALLRATRHFGTGKKLMWNTGLLAILHMGEDEFTNPFEGNRKVAIAGSSGLTLNLTGAAFYKLGKKTTLGLSAGIPLVVRDVRPDGLTRSWVIAPEISWSF